MPNTSSDAPFDPTTKLVEWIQRFVDLLRADGGYPWRLLIQLTADKVGLIELDGHVLQLEGRHDQTYDLLVRPAQTGETPHLRTDARTVRAIMAGQITFDKALTDGSLFIRGTLDDLIGFHQLIMNVLAEGPRHVALRRLWREFDDQWPRAEAPPALVRLEAQKPRHMPHVITMSASVLRVEKKEGR